jgi:hypothetical protein
VVEIVKAMKNALHEGLHAFCSPIWNVVRKTFIGTKNLWNKSYRPKSNACTVSSRHFSKCFEVMKETGGKRKLQNCYVIHTFNNLFSTINFADNGGRSVGRYSSLAD